MTLKLRPLAIGFFLFCSLTTLKVSSQYCEMALGSRRSLPADFTGFNGQNMIRDSLGWTNPYLIENLPKLNPKNLRYPGGGLANWWDWRTGWFMNVPNLPSSYQTLNPKENTLENFKAVLDATGSKAILVLNMISDTLPNQIEFLKYADSIGVNIDLVELGNEFYLEGGEDSLAIITKFPTPESYAIVASEWCDSIHKYFPNTKVAVQGAFNRNNAARRIIWDEGLLPLLEGHDVISYHTYMSAAASDEDDIGLTTFDSSDVPTLLYRPFRMWELLTTEDFPLLKSDQEIWVTEYNLRDHERPVHGSWAHGLFTATQTMHFLHDPRVRRACMHSMSGTAVGGALFNSVDGYEFGDEGNFIPPPNPPASTQYWGLTAAGHTITLLTQAMKGMTYAAPLEFENNNPLVYTVDGDDSVSYPSLYGWCFSNNDSTQVVLVNLSGIELKVKTQYLFPAGGNYERFFADPVMFQAYDEDLNHLENGVLPPTLGMRPYSIVRMYAPTVPADPPSEVSININGPSAFCFGDSVQLSVSGYYHSCLWSTGDTTATTFAKNDGEYWVRVRDNENGYWIADTVHITVYPLPEIPRIDNIPTNEFCDGDSLLLAVKFPDSSLTYKWTWGTVGTSCWAIYGGKYKVTAMDSLGCSSKSENTNLVKFPLPQPVITPGGAMDICFDALLTLDAGSGYKSYAWSNGKTGQTINVSATGNYSVTVKDYHNCYGTSPVVPVTVHEPVNPVVTVIGPTSFCTGQTPTTLKAPDGYSYQWQQGSTILATATKKKYYPANEGKYRVTITDAWGCTKRSDATDITVYNLPHTQITMDGDKKICVGVELITLSAASCGNCSFQWKLNTVNIPGAILPTYTALVDGDYKYEVTDWNGCGAKSKVKTIIDACSGKQIGASGSWNEQLLTLFPNPATSFVQVKAIFSNPGETALIQVRNGLGVLMKELKPVMHNGKVFCEVDTENFPQGIYILSLQSGNEIITQEFVIGLK